MKEIILSENHRRSIGTSLRVVEKHLNEMERELTNPDHGILYSMEVDINGSIAMDSLQNIREVKQQIKNLSNKYALHVENSLLSRKLESVKSSIWVILCDLTAKRLQGYGEFPMELAQEFDADIDKMLMIVNQL